jgi:hypothetical protein
MSVLIAKFQNTPYVTTIMQAITTIQNDLKTRADMIKSTAITIQQNTASHGQVAIIY